MHDYASFLVDAHLVYGLHPKIYDCFDPNPNDCILAGVSLGARDRFLESPEHFLGLQSHFLHLFLKNKAV